MDEKLLVKEELIGKNVTIKTCTDSTLTGISGVIVDETKNTFTIEVDGKEKVVAKNIATFEFVVDGRRFVIEGNRLNYRPEDRIKKAR